MEARLSPLWLQLNDNPGNPQLGLYSPHYPKKEDYTQRKELATRTGFDS